jgi:hypothetical protein
MGLTGFEPVNPAEFRKPCFLVETQGVSCEGGIIATRPQALTTKESASFYKAYFSFRRASIGCALLSGAVDVKWRWVEKSQLLYLL